MNVSNLCFDILHKICVDVGLEFINAIEAYDLYNALVKDGATRSIYMGTIYSQEAFDNLVERTTLITGIRSWRENPFVHVSEDMYLYIRNYITDTYQGPNKRILLKQLQMENMVRGYPYNLADVSQHCQYSCHPMLTISMLSRRMVFYDALPFLININDHGTKSNMVIDSALKTFCDNILNSTNPKISRLSSNLRMIMSNGVH